MANAPALIIGNGTLVTFGADNRLIAGGALLIEHGLVASLGDTSALRQARPRAEYIDARGGLIMPGMICAHTHTYGAFARGMALKDAPPTNFMQILERLWWRLDRALQPDDVLYSALVCLVDAVRHGTTTLIDHHASPNACAWSLDLIAQAFRQAGVRGCLCYEVSDRDGLPKARAGIRENERFLRSIAPSPYKGKGAAPSPYEGEGRDEGEMRGRGVSPSPHPSPSEGEGEGVAAMLSGMMGLHAAFTLSDATLAEAVGAAQNVGVGCHIHVAEDKADQDISLARYGERVVNRLQRLGVLGPRALAVHCVHVDASEIDILAESGALVVHNPRSNMNNAVGTTPVEQMLAQRITVGLGNDGFSNDMFVEMKAAYLAHKAAQGNPRAMQGDVVARLAIANNAHIAASVFGGGHSALRFGELAAGAPADVIVVDYRSPTPVSAGNLPWHMIFGIDGSMVTTTIVNGRLLMRDRQLLTLDEERIAARARELAAALWQRV